MLKSISISDIDQRNVDQRLASLCELIGVEQMRKGKYLGLLHSYQMFVIREFYGPGHSTDTIKVRDFLLQVFAEEEARIIKTFSPTFFEKVRAEGHKDLYSFMIAQGHIYHYQPTTGKLPV